MEFIILAYVAPHLCIVLTRDVPVERDFNIITVYIIVAVPNKHSFIHSSFQYLLAKTIDIALILSEMSSTLFSTVKFYVSLHCFMYNTYNVVVTYGQRSN